MAGWWQAGAPALTLARERRKAAECVAIIRIQVATRKFCDERPAQVLNTAKFKRIMMESDCYPL
jgi:hypothetical protein